jgi:quercetin dioxygenase-like cupin family protein
MKKCVIAALLVSTAVSAQTLPPAIVVNGDAMGRITAKAAADQAANPTPNQHEAIIGARPYNLSLERRVAKAPAASHANGAELMIVLDGAATLTTGGTIVNPAVNGANTNGPDITGGTPQHIARGDFILVPENVAHILVPDAGGLLLATMVIPHQAAAQSPGRGGRGGAPKLITHESEIPAMMEKAKAALPTAARFFAGDTLLSLAPIRVGLEYRSPKGIASVHKNDGEFMYVIAGEGNIPTGGTVTNPKDTGANIDGDALVGATDHLMKAGDFIFVPANVPHLAVSNGVFVLATLHVPAVN